MQIYSLTPEELAININRSKEIFLKHLHDSGHITEEVAQDYLKNYAFVVVKRSYFNEFWNKFVKKENEDRPALILVKQVSMEETEE